MTTTAPGDVIADHTQLDGFTERHGLRISPIGDDGDRFIVIGHHDPGVTVKALYEFLRRDMHWKRRDVTDHFETPQEMGDALAQTWAVFTSEDGGSNWWCDWDAKPETPNSIAITMLDFS